MYVFVCMCVLCVCVVYVCVCVFVCYMCVWHVCVLLFVLDVCEREERGGEGEMETEGKRGVKYANIVEKILENEMQV